MSPSAPTNPAWSAVFRACNETLFMRVALSDRRSISGQRLMLAVPMPCDVEPRRDPHPVALVNVVEKTRQRGRTSGPSDQAAMQPDRHHLGRIFALGIKHVEGVLEIVEELISAAKTLR